MFLGETKKTHGSAYQGKRKEKIEEKIAREKVGDGRKQFLRGLFPLYIY